MLLVSGSCSRNQKHRVHLILQTFSSDITTNAAAAAACLRSGLPGLSGAHSFFCPLRCWSWYCLESSQGRGPRMFFQPSKSFSCIFCRETKRNKQTWNHKPKSLMLQIHRERLKSRLLVSPVTRWRPLDRSPDGQQPACVSAHLILLLQDERLILDVHSGLQRRIQLRKKEPLVW